MTSILNPSWGYEQAKEIHYDEWNDDDYKALAHEINQAAYDKLNVKLSEKHFVNPVDNNKIYDECKVPKNDPLRKGKTIEFAQAERERIFSGFEKSKGTKGLFCSKQFNIYFSSVGTTHIHLQEKNIAISTPYDLAYEVNKYNRGIEKPESINCYFESDKKGMEKEAQLRKEYQSKLITIEYNPLWIQELKN